MKTFFIVVTVVSGGACFILMLMHFYNLYVEVCNDDHMYDETLKSCYYFAETCNSNETAVLVGGERACSYEDNLLTSASTIMFTVLFFTVLWIGALVAYIVSKNNLDKGVDFMNVDEAQECLMIHLSKKFNITMVNGKPDKNSFTFYKISELQPLDSEWIYRCQIEITSGDAPGVYSIITSLSKKRSWILGGNYKIRDCPMSNYKFDRDWPLYRPEDPKERLLEALHAKSPEKALELQQQMLENSITQQHQAPQVQEPNMQVPNQQMQYANRPKKRYYPWRRR